MSTTPTKPEPSAEPQRPRRDEDDTEEAKQLSDEELRLLADTMPGEGPGDD